MISVHTVVSYTNEELALAINEISMGRKVVTVFPTGRASSGGNLTSLQREYCVILDEDVPSPLLLHTRHTV